MTLGERLRSLIDEKGIDQKTFAELFNLSPTTVSGYVTNYRTPSDDLKKKFADYFCVSIDYLLGHTDNRNVIDNKTETKPNHNLDISGLPDEAIKQVEDYIEFIKQKYNPDGSIKK
ncbi:helix-turn-helix domain-containing protein [Ruminiclostridium cellobioparum]|uniref:Helix-turn-helix protein n=1 Tax=Ruminiclostridium cellobioparum subsp. termitidis CT1112 TaxID=1195236 RepID=S0FIT3_RUMCE|nr:helix-turn-helix transcriptional regulator [Ruminiclostridium cellobioparum]EMS70111.1 helix-turn-helix protein [Ruminiclostridium cellobioparum subsp. termitidis CT1112]